MRKAKVQYRSRKKKWAYLKDETDLNGDMNINQMMLVMALIGFDDQFEEFCKKEGIGAPVASDDISE